MHAVDVIETKRDRHRLSDAQIEWFIASYTRGEVADEQASALLMAILLNGMEDDELAVWTKAMIDSGERLDLRGVGRPTVDKHSTGGVGDKISLPLCPLVAACGAAVPQLSGRGLGHTGGTLDKMEAIAGWRARLTNAELVDQLRAVGAVICAAGEGLAPADRKLYALRDVTGTVPSIPLIASSIMSKKIAEGTESLVLDVKTGSGAFMKHRDDARRLAETMVRLGAAHGVRCVALVTDMSTPLGWTAGNALEVAESLDVLGGGGPADVRELTLALADEMVALSGVETAGAAARLDDGSARRVWDAMVRAQGGDPSAPLPEAVARYQVLAGDTGVIARLDALAVGVAAWRLGAGRARKEDAVSAGAGVRILAPIGSTVEKGQPLLELHTDDPGRFGAALEALQGGWTIAPEAPAPRQVVLERVTA